MNIFLQNTLTRQKELFKPLNSAHVGLYVCGPTVYDFAHIGNARPVVVFDVLRRVLQQIYPKVTYVRNITDVDDKINEASRQSGEPISAITERTTQAYNEDMAALGALPPDIAPRATDHISDMIEMIQVLIKKGHAYVNEGHVLFDVQTFHDYGHLSRRNREELIAGARVEIAPYKKDPADFVLWKPSDDQTPGWKSPWGRGRPGWHIECSAMSTKYLGPVFDIHGGGIDLSFPHHENEIAQSRCASGHPVFARYWVHNGHLTVNGEKMSKSLGNFFTVHQLLKEHNGEVIRLALLSTHYRQPLDWTDSTLHQAKQTLDRFYGVIRGISLDPGTSYAHDVFEDLCDDLNTPAALAHLHELTCQFYKASDVIERRKIASIFYKSATLMGLLYQEPEMWFQQTQGTDLSADEIESLIEKRRIARANKDFAGADCIRAELLSKGIILEDSPQGTTWRRS